MGGDIRFFFLVFFLSKNFLLILNSRNRSARQGWQSDGWYKQYACLLGEGHFVLFFCFQGEFQNLLCGRNMQSTDVVSSLILDLKIGGWMNDLRFYVLFSSISVILGQRKGDNERLHAWNAPYS